MKNTILFFVVLVLLALGGLWLFGGSSSSSEEILVGPYQYSHSMGGYSFLVPEGYVALDRDFVKMVNQSSSISQERKELFLQLIDIDLLGDLDVWLGGYSGQNQYFDIVIEIVNFGEIPSNLSSDEFYETARNRALSTNDSPDTDSLVYEISNENLDNVLAVNTTFFEAGSNNVKELRYSRFLINDNKYYLVSSGVTADSDIDLGKFDEEQLVEQIDTVARTFKFN